MNNIYFFKEGVSFRMQGKDSVLKWLKMMIRKEGFALENLNFIFCNDSYLKKMNKKYLDHNYNTDIITFDLSTEKKKLEGDIFISIDRVRVNSSSYKVTFKEELMRVMAHGVLHLSGYGDKSEKEIKAMRKKENEWLKNFND